MQQQHRDAAARPPGAAQAHGVAREVDVEAAGDGRALPEPAHGDDEACTDVLLTGLLTRTTGLGATYCGVPRTQRRAPAAARQRPGGR